jgi:hypothetical protein
LAQAVHHLGSRHAAGAVASGSVGPALRSTCIAEQGRAANWAHALIYMHSPQAGGHPLTLTATTLVPGATPTTPTPALFFAATMPAHAVPCPDSSCGGAASQHSCQSVGAEGGCRAIRRTLT